jgi:predicted RNase H-like HicB family nuclease
MKHNIKAYVYKGEKYYVAECAEINVVTQGKTLDETITNLQEAVSLYLEGEDPADYDLVTNPTILVIDGYWYPESYISSGVALYPRGTT